MADEYKLKSHEEVAHSTMTVAIFCKWGKHRSVALATLFFEALRGHGVDCTVTHLCKPPGGRFE